MKYIDEFRDPKLARELATAIKSEAQTGRKYRLMEFCGGHTHAIFRYGIPDLLPDNVEMVHGPGCPVCILPINRLDHAIYLAEQPNVILCSYGDMLRVPGSKQDTLLKARARGADIRMVYSTQDALKIAKENPSHEVIFFAIGFETTAPATAAAVLQAEKEKLKNFRVFCNHVLTPAAITAILESPEAREGKIALDGFLGPSHVSTVIGSQAYRNIAETYHRPIVIAGFEPLDVLQSILMLVQQLNSGTVEIENQYTRLVSNEGNTKAQSIVQQVFETRSEFEWRGLGFIPSSALRLRGEYQWLDVEHHYELPSGQHHETKGCECSSILRGVAKPIDCKLFGSVCTPENPMGSCMVSSEGACAAYWRYRRPNQNHSLNKTHQP